MSLPVVLEVRLHLWWEGGSSGRRRQSLSWTYRPRDSPLACRSRWGSGGPRLTCRTTGIRRCRAECPELRGKVSILDCWRRNLKRKKRVFTNDVTNDFFLSLHLLIMFKDSAGFICIKLIKGLRQLHLQKDSITSFQALFPVLFVLLAFLSSTQTWLRTINK